MGPHSRYFKSPSEGYSDTEAKLRNYSGQNLFQEGQTMGTLLLVSLPRHDTHLFAEYIRDKCDLSDNKGQPLDIAVTGVGSQTFKHTIEKELNIK